jgi:hypothetical protein
MKCLSVTSAYRAVKQLKLRRYVFKAMHRLQQGYVAARIQYCDWFHRFVREGVRVWYLVLRFKWNGL